jgi:anthranilate synthase component 1
VNSQPIILPSGVLFDVARVAEDLTPDRHLVFERFDPATRLRSHSIVGLRWHLLPGENFRHALGDALATGRRQPDALHLVFCGHDASVCNADVGDPPPFAVYRIDEYLEIDHAAGIASHRWTGSQRTNPRKLEDSFADASSLFQPGGPDRKLVAPEWTIDTTFENYRARVAAIQHAIDTADVEGAVLSIGMTHRTIAAPLHIYREMIRINPSTFGFLVSFGDSALIGGSLLRFLDYKHGVVTLETDAGTRPVTGDAAADDLARTDLVTNPKDASEHALVVNEEAESLLRIAVPTQVTRLVDKEVRTFSHVMHLYTVLSARIREGLDLADVLLGLFPPAAVSGRPRRRALALGIEVEGQPRGPYGGVIGMLRGASDAELAVVIRSLWIDDGYARLRVGGKIVADSVAEAEFAEARNKARFLIESVYSAEQAAAAKSNDG